MDTWFKALKTNPFSALLGSDDPALLFFVERDLLGNISGSVEDLWDLPNPQKVLSKQQHDGSWRYHGNRPGDEFGEAYELLETWKTLRGLVEMAGFNRKHPGIERACEFILTYQTAEGDIRGILSNQYIPYYMGAILEILIKAGYIEDERIESGMKWLLEMRQSDGGWIIPMTMFKMREYYRLFNQPPIPPEKDRPFSHMATGMVIRAFAAHPVYRRSQEAVHAGNLLKNRFFKKDVYTSRQNESYWLKFQFPFWWADLLTVMDSLKRMEFEKQDKDIQKGINWFIENQAPDGLWAASYGGSTKGQSDYWITLAICRVLRYFLE
ncbi:MAG TPA: hypothetical protein VMW28_01630 [Pelolinea sp.]|nr:hypothetical protein [Pelolinea sp.]